MCKKSFEYGLPYWQIRKVHVPICRQYLTLYNNGEAFFAAIHPLYGLVWTNGTAIFLASIDIDGDKLNGVSSTQLAVFE